MLGACEYEGGEAGGEDPLVGNGCMEVEALFFEGDGFLKWELQEGRVGEEGNGVVDFALAEGEDDRRDAEKYPLEAGEGCRVWKRGV